MSSDKYDAFSQQDRAFGGPNAYEQQSAKLPSEERMSSDIKRRLRDAEVGEAFQTGDGSPELQRTALGQEAAARIEALEGEVAAAREHIKDVERGSECLADHLEKAEARAERLRVALEGVYALRIGSPTYKLGRNIRKAVEIARKALEDKQ